VAVTGPPGGWPGGGGCIAQNAETWV